MTHSECIKQLKAIGEKLGYHAVGRSYGKMYHMGNPDCVWYQDCTGKPPLIKIMRGDQCKCKRCRGQKELYLPIIAFEVPNSEQQKALRGSLVTLQVTNAAASIIVLIGESANLKSYVDRLSGRYSSTRFRIWTEKNVIEMYKKVVEKGKRGRS